MSNFMLVFWGVTPKMGRNGILGKGIISKIKVVYDTRNLVVWSIPRGTKTVGICWQAKWSTKTVCTIVSNKEIFASSTGHLFVTDMGQRRRPLKMEIFEVAFPAASKWALNPWTFVVEQWSKTWTEEIISHPKDHEQFKTLTTPVKRCISRKKTWRPVCDWLRINQKNNIVLLYLVLLPKKNSVWRERIHQIRNTKIKNPKM